MFIIERKPKSISAESFRELRTNIQYSSYDKEMRTILVTSSEPGEGKSTISGNLALSFAQADKKVILIDCDLRKPSLHQKFHISNLAGLSDVLVGQANLEETIVEYADNLHILTSGKIPPNPAEMLDSKLMEILLNEIKEHYDIVILDSSPLLAVTDAQVLSRKVDGTIVVVKAEHTKRQSVLRAKSLLDMVGATIIGTVINCVDKSRKNYYYYGTEKEKKNKEEVFV
ncbi:CpsD/CapB family tyrosine-protein kinase [Inconstantimicrobium mannanitabidum]|uniref:Tyrosine protein kinase n=1 Tax=Inconstantimicrobium mannanitabidum TaxID=1604901 RepID=A0ACB5RF49_9CLOT|nr:CpsD/CapB family tyrosine-protein kinase [Clostridium sp. TW13]GKX67444.1 tyrosine protein kinase [Clostridium sp. TW13]